MSAALITATTTSRCLHAADGASDDPGREIRIGLIGCGGRGTGAINDSLTINDKVRLVAMADIDRSKCERTLAGMSRRHGSKVDVKPSRIHVGLDGYKEVLSDPEVDLVLIASPPGFHPSHTLQATRAGKHVFCEKPSCVDPAGYRICLEAHAEAVRRQTAIVTGTQYRRQVNYVGAVEQIRDGAIGEIIGAQSRYCSNGIWYKNRKEGVSDTQYQLDNWMHFTWLAGDQICEQAVHNIDTMNWVMGAVPQTAFGSGGRFTRPDDSEMWDSMSIDYVYPGDRVLSFMCRQIPGTKGDNGNVIYGSKGIAFIGAGSSGSRIVDRDGNEIWSMKGSIADAYKQEHKDLVDSIRAGQPIVEFRQTAESSLTAVMGRVAAYTGQEVSWEFVSEQSKLDLFPPHLDWNGDLPEPACAVPGKTKLI
ncbi:Alpha-N-acetylgalactosaminidase [Stieleria maiorica]|uniref:Alpha-N-acetylgalactosaminidase n=2 Tax=Stieleria maiorica TaxID=2795974 RepID=A0A5B9MQP8_9BACT|nr:Alpha-N-acetylgalactosaminidase [Stieleria maiorica]